MFDSDDYVEGICWNELMWLVTMYGGALAHSEAIARATSVIHVNAKIPPNPRMKSTQRKKNTIRGKRIDLAAIESGGQSIEM